MPDENPITVSFILTPEEVRTVRSVFFGQRRNERIIAAVLILLVAALFTYGILAGRLRVDWAAWDVPSFLIITVTCLALLFYFRWQRVQAERQAIAQDPTTNRRIEMQFSPEGVTSKIEGLSQTAWPWGSFVRVRRTALGFLFYQGPRTCVWVPTHAFTSNADAEAVGALAKERIANYSES